MRRFGLDYYVHAATLNNRVMSRTVANGRVERGVSADKPVPVVQGKELVSRVEDNVVSAIEYMWYSQDAGGVFVQQVISRIADGIFDSAGLRTHGIPEEKPYGYPVSALEDEFARFLRWYDRARSVSLSEEEVAVYCAITEYVFECVHFLPDACGRTGRLLSLNVCLQNDAPVRAYQDRKEYYRAMGEKRGSARLYDEDNAFVSYYVSLPCVGAVGEDDRTDV